jgi:hypothetical protein
LALADILKIDNLPVENGDLHMRIININGFPVRKYSIRSSSLEIHPELENGVYYFVISDNFNILHTGKLIIVH